jgi:uncharacterized OsmC-like protein
MSSAAPTRDDALRTIVAATTDAVSSDPDRGHVVFRASGSGGDGVLTHLQIGRHTALVDEPPALGGNDAAPNPVETALAGLVSCQVVTYRFWAAHLGIPFDEIVIEVEGDLDVRGFFGVDAAVRPGFGEVRLVVTLDGPETAQRYQELAAAVDEHCPVLDLFRNPTSVTTSVRTA